MVLSKFANKSFFTRLLSGIVLVALMLATIIPGGNILFVANLLISVVGVYELYKVLGIEKNSLGITGYIAVLAYYAVLYFDKKEYGLVDSFPIIDKYFQGNTSLDDIREVMTYYKQPQQFINQLHELNYLSDKVHKKIMKKLK